MCITRQARYAGSIHLTTHETKKRFKATQQWGVLINY